MSHFTALVITNTQPSEEELQTILMPWHEYECTGYENEYVQDVDQTEEALAEYAKATVTRLKDSSGNLHNQFNEQGEWKPEFSQPDPLISGHRIGYVPPGYEVVELPASELETAAEWISDYYGYGIVDVSPGEKVKYGYIQVDSDGNVVKVIDRTNPNKKWDWWVIGGRWSGLLRLHDGSSVDQAMIGDVDINTLRQEAREKAEKLWDEVHAVIAGLPSFETWDTVRERSVNIDAARDFYNAQPVIAALKAHFKDSWMLERETDAAYRTREDFCQRGEDSAFVTFAVVKDNQWYERGEMGWWAFVSNEKDQADWSAEFAKLLNDLPSTAWLTVVDCHI